MAAWNDDEEFWHESAADEERRALRREEQLEALRDARISQENPDEEPIPDEPEPDVLVEMIESARLEYARSQAEVWP